MVSSFCANNIPETAKNSKKNSETPDPIPIATMKIREYRPESVNCDRVVEVILKTGVTKGGGGEELLI